MDHLPSSKKFPGLTGVETPAEVIIHRPIPRRKVPLKGIKSMMFPKKPMEIQMGHEVKTRWDYRWMLRMMIFWLLLVPAGLFVFFVW